jgi:hypothetical protein
VSDRADPTLRVVRYTDDDPYKLEDAPLAGAGGLEPPEDPPGLLMKGCAFMLALVVGVCVMAAILGGLCGVAYLAFRWVVGG